MGTHRTPYPAEFRAQMVELLKARRRAELEKEFEPTAQTIDNWVAQAGRDAGGRHDGLTTVVSQLAKLERELVMLQAAVTQTDERYGVEHLHLTVSAPYVAMLVSNEHVSHWLNERHPDFAAQFERKRAMPVLIKC